ncbi:MAG TPA: WhiB family transcriptional regulator [Acidimicrobiales bacterium]|nr:WhiB family transcriptional regulator [Acidimicrobiales bacterium]
MRSRGSVVDVEDEHLVDRAAASCGGTGASIALFFSDSLDAIARAKEICRTCSQVEPCLRGAVARREPCGVWGGELFADGVILAHKRRRGRPRKDEVLLASA